MWLKIIGPLLYALIEAWIGRTKKVEANSILEIIWNLIKKKKV